MNLVLALYGCCTYSNGVTKTKRNERSSPKTIRFEMRISPDEQEEWRVAAARARRTLAQWVRDCCNAVALVLVVLLSACTDQAPAPGAPITCGPTDDTENGGSLYSCTTTGGHDGLCTVDPHNAIQCFATCTAQFECDHGESSYVLALQDGTRVCYCMADNQP